MGNEANMEQVSFTPIGYVKSAQELRYQTPRQVGVRNSGGEAIIELLPHLNYEQALSDLHGFDYIWVLWLFHATQGHWKPKVMPPRGSRKRGVFATRSPHRPNPIGMTACRLLSVEGRIVRIEQADFIHGTPILDIKPYLPYADSFPEATVGWLNEEPFIPPEVLFTDLALQQCAWLEHHAELRLVPLIFSLLHESPIERQYRRVKKLAENEYILAIRSWRIALRFHSLLNRFEVLSIYSGYSYSALVEDVEHADMGNIHLRFQATFKA
jgi:tRNA-Thr(GGU) m(6)t(6)A37 methyltransferase TsaA